MLLKKNSFSRKHCYALNMDSFKSNGFSSSIEVIAFTVTKNRPTIAIGRLSSYRDKASTLEEFKELNDSGMNTLFKWNGVEMWSSSNKFVEEMAAWKQLDALYRQAVVSYKNIQEPDLSLVPGNYEGWFARL